MLNRIKFILKYKNKFDFSASFATYSIASSFMSRVASKNNCLWGHADYLTLFENDENRVKDFFKTKKYKQPGLFCMVDLMQKPIKKELFVLSSFYQNSPIINSLWTL